MPWLDLRSPASIHAEAGIAPHFSISSHGIYPGKLVEPYYATRIRGDFGAALKVHSFSVLIYIISWLRLKVKLGGLRIKILAFCGIDSPLTLPSPSGRGLG